jgi:hypothetical protein
MDQDDQSQVCVAPDQTSDPTSTPPVSMPPDATPATPDAAPGPNAGDDDNPLLAAVSGDLHGDATPELADSPPVDESTAGGLDAFGKVGDFAANVAKAKGLGDLTNLTGRGAGALALAGDANSVYKGFDEMENGHGVDGAFDTAAAVTGTVADMASMAKGGSALADPLNVAKGAIETGHGLGQLADAATQGPLQEGQSGRDAADEAVDGVENVFKGAGDAMSGAGEGNPWLKGAGISLNAGMAAGNLLAPVVFGDMKNTGKQSQAVPMNPDGSEGKFNPSTGNPVIDWMAGVGDYTNGRF